MKKIVLAAFLTVLASSTAMADNFVYKGKNGKVNLTTSNSTITNLGSISGGTTDTGLTVKGSNNTVVNNGTITGTTGVSMSGSGSSSFTNTGTIKATSTGTSSASAVGVSIK